MRFSDIKGERCLEVISELIDPITALALDPDAAEFFQRRVLPEGEDLTAFVLKRMRRSYPALMKTHRAELVHIMATLEGVSDEEYLTNINMSSLIIGLSELMTDPYFRSFFVPAQSRNDENVSASASESTGDV